MKKFMIFLLMAFLYLGTCQARSEAAHFDNANVKLHSWVTPTSHSFFMDSKAMLGDPIVTVTPSQPQNLCLTCPHSSATFGVAFDGNGSGETVASYTWLVNEHPTSATGNTFTFEGYGAGHYTVACQVTTALGHRFTSNYVEILVDQDVIVNIEGPDHACQEDIVTLTAQVEGSSVEVAYQWRRDGQPIPGATNASYSFRCADLPGLTDTLVYEFDVLITRAGCDSKYSPVHYFSVSPTPNVVVEYEPFCADEPVTFVANAYTSGNEQPYKWLWVTVNVGANDTTETFVNTYTTSTFGEGIIAVPVYQDFSCNSESETVEPKSLEETLGISGSLNDLTVTPSATNVCLNGMVRLAVTDPNTEAYTTLGDATYTWYMNGTVVDGASDTVLTIALPNSGTYTFNVVATYADYPCATVSGNTQVAVDTVPLQVAITGGNVICPGQSSPVLTAVVIPTTGTYEYMWKPTQSTFSDAVTFNAATAQVYAVVARSASGCEAISAPFEVYTFGSDLQITASAMNICKGDDVTLSADMSEDWQGSTTYSWAPVTSSFSTINVQPTETTTYKVTVSDGACYAVDSITINVNDLPAVPELTDLSPICEGVIAEVTANSTSTDVEAYMWFLDGFEIPGENLPNINLSNLAVGSHTIAARAIDTMGCISNLSQSANIVVQAVPAAIAITGNDIVCDGATAVLTASSSDATATYTWDGATTGNTFDAPAGVHYVIASANGCESEPAYFTVHSIGTDLQLTASALNICKGNNVTLNANISDILAQNASYAWSNSLGNMPTVNAQPTETTTYHVTVTAGSCTHEDSITVNVNAAPATPTLSGIPSEPVCEGTFVEDIEASSSGAHHYNWYLDGVQIPGQNLAELQFTATGAGVHYIYVEAVNAQGCVSERAGDMIEVEVAPANVAVSGVNMICQEAATEITVHSDDPNAKYSWDGGSFATTTTYNATVGLHYVVAQSENGCNSEPVTFTIEPFGTDLQVTASSTFVCPESHVTLNANISDVLSGNVVYTWSNGLTGPTIDVQPSTTTTYVVTAVYGPCSHSESIIINVYEPQTPSIAAHTADNETVNQYDILCEGTQIQFLDEDKVSTFYKWYVDDIEIPGQNQEEVELSLEPGWHYVCMRGVSPEGCLTDQSCLGFTIEGAPTNVAISGNPVVCNAVPNTFTVTSSDPNAEYSWDGGDFSDENTFEAGEGVHYVTARSEHGCVAEPLSFNVVSFGTDFQISASATTVCPGAHVTLNADLSDIVDNDIYYLWNTGDTVPTIDRIPSEDFATLNGNYCVTATYGECQRSVCIHINVFEPDAFADHELNVVVTNETHNDGTDFTVCEGEDVYVTATLDGEVNNNYRYIWHENGRLMPLITGPTFHKQLTILDEDTTTYYYTVAIEIAGECADAAAVGETSNKVLVKRNPIVTIAGNHNVCYYAPTGNYNVHLVAWVDGDFDTNVSYTWYEHGQERYSVAGSIFDNHYRENWVPSYDNPYSFTVMVTNSDGCTTISEPFEVNVYNKPVVNVTADQTTICEGGEVNVTAHLDNYNDPMLTYQWYMNGTDPDNLIPGMTEATETFTPEDTTTYIVKVTHLMDELAQNCVGYSSIVVNVNNDPVVVSVTSDLAEGDTICEGRFVNLTAHIEEGVPGGEVYTWYRNGEIIEGAVDSTYQETPQAENGDVTTYVYSVSVRQAASGCESDVVAYDTITVLPNPVLVLVTDPIVCDTNENNIVMFANVTPAPATTYSFTWYEDNQVLTDGTLMGEHNDSIKLSRPYRDYAYDFSVELVNEYGCTVRDEASVLVNDNPVVHATVTENNICVGGEITLTANLDDYNANMLEFHWYDNGELMPLATELTYTYVPEFGNHVYTMTAFQRNSLCIATSNEVVVDVVNDPVVESVTSDLAEGDTICEGRYVTLTAHVTGGVTGGETFTWYRNGAVIEGAVEAIYQETPQAENGDITTYIYGVSVAQTAAGCESNITYYDTITVYPNPVLDLVTDPIVCDTLENNIVMYANVTPAPATTYSFTWYEDNQVLTDGTMMGDHNDSIKLTRPYRDYAYNFSVELVNEYGCTTRDDASILVNDNPVVHATVTENNICIGGEITLTANLDDYNADMLEFHWYDNGELMPLATELTYTYVPELGNHVYTMTAFQRNSLCIATSNEVVVDVVNDPVVESVTSDLAEGDTICEGRYVTLTAHVTGGVTGGEIFTWYRNGEVIEGAVEAVYQETPQAENGDITTYVYGASVAQTAAGCESNITYYDTITVYPNPVLELVTDPIVCDTLENNIVMYANVTPAPTTTYSFTWYEDNQVLTDGTMMGEHNDSIKLTRPYRDYAYSFSVELVNEYGCTTRDNANVLVNDNPVVHATVTENNICVGGEITLTANLDDYNADMLEFHWYDNGELMPLATEMTHTLVPELGHHVYTMTAFQRNSLCIATSNEVIVDVVADPVVVSVTTDLDEGNDTICEGRFVTLTAHIEGGVTGGEIYTWYRNGEVIEGAVDSVYQETPQAVNGDPTTYDYTVSVRQTAAGCESNVNGYNTITVLPNPVLVLVTDPIVCDTNENNIVMYANVTPAPTSTYRFTWYEDNQVIADGTMMGDHYDSIRITRPYRDYAYDFSVELVNAYGCTVRDEASVLVNDNPVVHATVTENTICVGGEITLTANLDDYNADMLEFHWYDNGELMPLATEMTYTYVPELGNHVYTMTALQRNSLCIATSNEVIVDVIPDPIIASVTLSDYIACQGVEVTITANPGNYTPASTDVYTWYRNGVRIPGATTQTITEALMTVDNNTQTYVYSAVVTREPAGCTSEPVASQALTVYRNPVVAITGDQHVCETDYTFLIANVDTVGMNVGNLHYTWFINGDIRDNNAYNLGDSRFFAEYLYPRDEPYIFTVSVERGDVANACASISEPFEVYVYPKPEVNITANATDICENGSVTLQANLNDYNADHMTFQWYEVRTAMHILAVDYLPGGGYVYDTVYVDYNYNIPGATGFRYTTTLAETTTIGVTVTQTTSECYDVDEFTVTVHPTPPAPVISVDNSMICSAGEVHLTITNDYSEYGMPIYSWMQNGQLIPGAHGYTYQPETNTLESGMIHNFNAIVAFNMPGCISVVSENADVTVIPDPVATVVANGPTTICEGGEVTFQANVQPTTLDYTYQWYNSDVLMEGDTNATLTVSPDAHQQNYNYRVVINSLPGCQIVADAPTVTVLADPVVTLSIDNPIICQGGTSTLTVNVEGGIANIHGIDPYTYYWYSNNNTETPFDTTSVNYYVLPTNLETDSFAYWVEVAAYTYGCATTSEHVNQMVIEDPIVTIMVAPTYPETVCDGGNTLLIANVEGGFGENSYQWFRNETILVGETNPTLNTGILSVNDLNSYRVIVTQTGSGCENVSEPFVVPVIPVYDVTISALNNATVCEGGTTTLEATITNNILPNDNPTFQWYEQTPAGDLAIYGATSTRYTTSPLLLDGNHTYYVAVNSQITGSGCSAHSQSFTTTILDDPTVVISTTQNDNVICEGDLVHINATVTPVGGDYTYTWTWSNGTNDYTFVNNEPSFTPADLPASTNAYLFNVSIASTDPNSGCDATSNSNVYVIVIERPDVTITADNNVVCAGGQVELTANHESYDYTGFNYSWNINGNDMAQHSQSIMVPANLVTEGNITAHVKVTSSQLTLNCFSEADLSTPVQVIAQPTVSASADFTTMCAGAAPTFTATVNGAPANAALTYVWRVGGQIISGANGSTYQPGAINTPGTYTYSVVAMSQNTELNCMSDMNDAGASVVVRVAETPVVDITPSDALGLCAGGSITLTATVVNANNTPGDFTNGSIYGAYNYVWLRDNNVVATNNNIALHQNQITETLNTAGNYNYTVNVTPVGPLANGCGVAANDTYQVVVYERPNWDAAVVSAQDGNICLGEEVQLYAHITGGVTDMNGNTNGHIQWVVEYNGVISNVNAFGGTATHIPTAPGVYTYYPTYVSYSGDILGSGCAFTNSDEVSTFVTVHELPTAAFVSGDGTVLCANVSDHTGALTIHFTGTPPFHFVLADLNTGSTTMYDSYTNDYTIYVSPDQTTQYRITFLSDNYCNNGELGMDAIATVFVNDIRFEETLFQAQCDEDVVTINFNMFSGTANSEFTVVYDNGLVVTGHISNNTATFATPNVPGDHHAIFSVGGCDYDIIVRVPVGIDDFTDGTTPFMMQRWDDVAIINNNPATNGGHTFVSYQWYKNGELIPGAIYKNYQEIGGLNGFYSIEVVSVDADGRTVTYRTCEQYFTSNTQIKVYPVPANIQQVITVEFDMTEEELEGAVLDIYDVTGSIINHVENVEPVTKVSGFKAQGTYFGRLTTANNEIKTVKFVIVK